MLSNKELVQYSFFILFLLKKEKLEVKNQEHFVSDIYLQKEKTVVHATRCFKTYGWVMGDRKFYFK